MADNSQQALVGIGSHALDGKHKTMQIVERFSPGEFEKLRNSCQAVALITRSEEYVLLERNYNRMLGCQHFYSAAAAAARTPGVLNYSHAVSHMASEILNWLTATRTLVDHFCSQMSDLFGKNSDQYKALNDQISAQYDSSKAYRVLYSLRNYVQHKGLPLDQVTEKLEGDGERRSMSFTLSRDRLLAGYAWKAQVAEDIRSMPEDIDVVDLIVQATPCFRRIYGTMLDQLANRAGAEVAVVEELAGKVPTDAGRPHLVEFANGIEPDTEDNPLTVIAVPVEIAAWLSNPEARDTTIGRLMNGLPPSQNPAEQATNPNETDATREVLRRGAALMFAYFADGSTGPNFAEAVNKTIEENGGIEYAMNEITFVAAVALSMAGQAVGTSAQDILGGLLEKPS